MAMEYCNDAESAVLILILSQRWTAAVQSALKSQRKDLLTEEVAPAVRLAAHELLKALPIRSARQISLVSELQKLWGNPQLRLSQVASTEPHLGNTKPLSVLIRYFHHLSTLHIIEATWSQPPPPPSLALPPPPFYSPPLYFLP